MPMYLNSLSIITRRVRRLLFSGISTAVFVVSGIGAAPLLISQTALAATITVCASGCNYTTIQAAVTGSTAGDVINVGAGTYAESVTIDKTLTLNGARSGTSATSGRTHGDASESVVIGGPTYNQAAFIVIAPNVVIDGFDFGPAVTNPTQGVIGVDLGSSSDAVVKNSIFQNNQRGISLNGASNVTVDGSLFKDNNSSPENNASIWGDNVTTITIKNSAFSGASNTAINLAGSQHITIDKNSFINNGNSAVIWNDSDATFSNNTGSGFTGSALFITGSATVLVNKNAFTSGSGNGISVSTASGNTSSGITITDNTLTGFLKGINVAAGSVSDVVAAHNNSLAGNSTAGISAPVVAGGPAVVNATDNWWGSASGPKDVVANDGSTPDTNPTGTGTNALGAIKYGPWCTSSDCKTYPVTKDDCKNDRWMNFTGVTFKNQGDCVSYVASGGKAKGNPSVLQSASNFLSRLFQ